MSDWIDNWAINYDRTDSQLEAWAVFCVCVAGKQADTTARLVDRLLYLTSTNNGHTVFERLRDADAPGSEGLAWLMKLVGFGCYNQKSKTILSLCQSDLNLRTCRPEDLEAISGIGPKTARLFILFSRRGIDNLAILDIWILRWLRQKGHDVPEHMPSAPNSYRRIEKLFLGEWHRSSDNETLAQFDLRLWQEMRSRRRET